MKNILLYTSLVLLLWSGSYATTIATVNNREITYEQLAEEMESIAAYTDLPYAQIRQIALDNLISEQTLIIYAQENNIGVDNSELESFFIAQFGDLPRFNTNGEFDYQKYLDFSYTETGREILQEIRREILLTKVETLIRSSFDLSEEALFRQFIRDNVNLDIGYTLVDLEAASVDTFFTPEAARAYYEKFKKNYRMKEQVRIEFVIIPFSDFQEAAMDYWQAVLEPVLLADTSLTESQLDSLQSVFLETEIRSRALTRAEDVMIRLQQQENTPYPLMTTWLRDSKNDTELPASLYDSALSMKKGQIAEPVLIEPGYLVFRPVEFNKPRQVRLSDIAPQVWHDYRQYATNQVYADQMKEYFINHIDDFIVPVAIVRQIIIPGSPLKLGQGPDLRQKNLQELIDRYWQDEKQLDRIVSQHRLADSHQIIFLEKYTNQEMNGQIASGLKAGNTSGWLTRDNDLIFYLTLAYFPEYIPDWENVYNVIDSRELVIEIDTTEFRKFYDLNSKDFMTPDSLRLGGVFFPAPIDSVQLPEMAVRNYYEENINLFYREKSVIFNCIWTSEQENAANIPLYFAKGADFPILQYCFDEGCDLPAGELVKMRLLPPVIEQILSEMRDQSISGPVAWRHGWLILYKKISYPDGLWQLEQVRPEIETMLKKRIADELAREKTRAVFDSTTYFSQCYNYAPENVFKTGYHPADGLFEILGDISEYREELLRLWPNEKYSSLVRLENGYAVVFKLAHKAARQLSYEQALPKIREIFTAREKVRLAREYVYYLRRQVLEGEDPDFLFQWFGGWLREYNLTLDSNFLGGDFSRLLLEDAASREEGYCSPPISMSENKLLFYKLYRLQKAPKELFYLHRDEYERLIQDEKYNLWLERYRSRLDINIFQ
ncbi:MAG: peptidyl-prolyl cis-trans isomerase [Candidatus Cloacimonetes bacterium]|nr:peptidyl-prolyl cis-trans isomerase [Candidatus Cloacimonadota bacterium]